MIPPDRSGLPVSTLPGLDDVAEPLPGVVGDVLREHRRIVALLRAAGLYLAADLVERDVRATAEPTRGPSRMENP